MANPQPAIVKLELVLRKAAPYARLNSAQKLEAEFRDFKTVQRRDSRPRRRRVIEEAPRTDPARRHGLEVNDDGRVAYSDLEHVRRVIQ